MPASHDRMTTAVRSASGPPPVSHGRATSQSSTGVRAKPASHSLRRQSGRPVVGRIAGPYRHCHSVERAVGRTRAGHVHAGRIADGVNSRGAALCASGLAPCGVSWAGTVVPDRQRRAAATPRGYRAERGHPPCTANHQPHHQDGLVPLCCHRRAYTRSSWGLACQSGRLGPDTVGPARAGPCVAPSPTAPRPSSAALQLTWPLACLPRHTSPSIAGGALSLTGDSDAAPAARAARHRATTTKLGLGCS